MKAPTISDRPLLIGVLLQRAGERAARRRHRATQIERVSRVAMLSALLALTGFVMGAALALIVHYGKALLP